MVTPEQRAKKTEYMRGYRARNREKMLQYLRRYKARQPEKWIEFKRKWNLDNKEKHNEYNRNYYHQNKANGKDKARMMSRYYKYQGIIEIMSCVICGSAENLEMHHQDYNNYLDVTWLCRKHHVLERIKEK